MTVSPRGIRSPIPAGNLIGRSRGKGTGAASLVPIADIAQSLQATGAILPPGAPSPLMPIATHTILANPTGSTAAPIATTTPNSSSITWAYGATTLTASISATYAGQTSITTLGTIGTGTWQGTKVGLAYGGTNADLSATGGAHKFLAQVTTGAAITVAQPATGDLSDISTFNLSTSGTATAASYDVTGTAGAGFLHLPPQSSSPSAPTTGLKLSASPANGYFLYITNKDGFIVELDTTALSASHSYIFPNVTGTIVTTGDTGSVSNTMLANSTVTVGSTSISLGATSTSLAGLTTVSMNNQLTNTLATGTAPFAITSTTRVANLNVATAGNADTVTTNANLTGPITSVGNATSIASQTGTGTKFVVDTSPTLVTPNLGTPSALVLTNATGTFSGTFSGTLSDAIHDGFKVSTAQLDKTSSTAFATITGLQKSLTAGATYVFRGHLTVTSGAAGGMKIRLVSSGTLTATSFSSTALGWNGTTANAQTTTTTLGNTIIGTNAVYTDIWIEGVIVVNAAGAMLVQMAQNTSDGTTSSVYINSDFSWTRVA